MTEKKASIKRIAKISAAVILIIVILVNLLTIVFSSAGLRTQLNWMPFACLSVTSGSMEPDFSAGDMIIVSDVPLEEIEPGDIITYCDSEGGFTTHRLIRRDGNNLITKGTANAYEDDPVNRGAYCAKLVAVIPGFGRILDIMSQPAVSAAAVALIAVLFYGVPALFRLFMKKKEQDGVPKKYFGLRGLAALALATVFAITPFMTAARYRAKVYDYKATTAAYVCFTSNYLGPVDVNRDDGTVTGGYTFKNSGWDGKSDYTFPLEIRNYTNQLRFNDTVDVPYVLYTEKKGSADTTDTKTISPDKYEIKIETSIVKTDADKTKYHVDISPNNHWSDTQAKKDNIYGPYLLKQSASYSYDRFIIKVVKFNCPVLSESYRDKLDSEMPIKNEATGERWKKEDVVFCGQELHFCVMACTDQNSNYYQEMKGDFTIGIAEETEFMRYTVTDNAGEGGDADSFVKLELETVDFGDGGKKDVYIYWDAAKMYFNESDSHGLNVLKNKTLYYSGRGTPPSGKGCTEGTGKIVIPVGTCYWAQMNFIKFSQYSTTNLSEYVFVTSDSSAQPDFPDLEE